MIAPRRARKNITPLLAGTCALTGLFALGVYLLPLPDPPEPTSIEALTTAGDSPTTGEAAATPATGDTPPPPAWVELADKFAGIVEPPKPTADSAPELAQSSPAEPVASEPALPPIEVQFRGFIAAPGGSAALLTGNFGQRFAFEGSIIPDTADPQGPGLIVKRVSKAEVLLERRGKEVSLAFTPSEPMSELARRYLAQRAAAAAPAQAEPPRDNAAPQPQPVEPPAPAAEGPGPGGGGQ
jgi:hypothetical protein